MSYCGRGSARRSRPYSLGPLRRTAVRLQRSLSPCALLQRRLRALATDLGEIRGLCRRWSRLSKRKGFVGQIEDACRSAAPPRREDYGRFDAAILLSEVAVTGTVEDVVLGFGPRANPVALLALSDVVPLHARSPVPRYVLLPLGRAVIADRVFCGAEGDGQYEPRVGARLVVVGS